MYFVCDGLIKWITLNSELEKHNSAIKWMKCGHKPTRHNYTTLFVSFFTDMRDLHSQLILMLTLTLQPYKTNQI